MNALENYKRIKKLIDQFPVKEFRIAWYKCGPWTVWDESNPAYREAMRGGAAPQTAGLRKAG